MKTIFATVVALVLMTSGSRFAGAGDLFDQSANSWAKKSFVIVASLKSYRESLAKAKEAAKAMNYRLDLRGLSPHKKIGLTFPKAVCEREFDEYPCYFPRGRYDDGKYVSIEFSSAFKSFSKGYYVVIVANDDSESDGLKGALRLAKTKGYPDAYIKSDDVYLGCMH